MEHTGAGAAVVRTAVEDKIVAGVVEIVGVVAETVAVAGGNGAVVVVAFAGVVEQPPDQMVACLCWWVIHEPAAAHD